MKRILLSIIAVFAFTIAQAQEENPGFSKNDFFVTGSFNYADSTKDFNFSSTLNTFVTDNISVGVGYSRVQNGSIKTNDISVNARNYFTPSNQFSLFGELGTTMNLDGGSNFNIQVNPGINYFISNSFSLETKLGLINFDTETSDFTFGTSLNAITLGLNYRF